MYEGMKILIERDGAQWTAKDPDLFVNLMESNIGFGETIEAAVIDFMSQF
jgi:hypothetical protein